MIDHVRDSIVREASLILKLDSASQNYGSGLLLTHCTCGRMVRYVRCTYVLRTLRKELRIYCTVRCTLYVNYEDTIDHAR
jgi:hypothetical protein